MELDRIKHVHVRVTFSESHPTELADLVTELTREKKFGPRTDSYYYSCVEFGTPSDLSDAIVTLD